jgi:hypothetical protein
VETHCADTPENQQTRTPIPQLIQHRGRVECGFSFTYQLHTRQPRKPQAHTGSSAGVQAALLRWQNKQAECSRTWERHKQICIWVYVSCFGKRMLNFNCTTHPDAHAQVICSRTRAHCDDSTLLYCGQRYTEPHTNRKQRFKGVRKGTGRCSRAVFGIQNGHWYRQVQQRQAPTNQTPIML